MIVINSVVSIPSLAGIFNTIPVEPQADQLNDFSVDELFAVLFDANWASLQETAASGTSPQIPTVLDRHILPSLPAAGLVSQSFGDSDTEEQIEEQLEEPAAGDTATVAVTTVTFAQVAAPMPRSATPPVVTPSPQIEEAPHFSQELEQLPQSVAILPVPQSQPETHVAVPEQKPQDPRTHLARSSFQAHWNQPAPVQEAPLADPAPLHTAFTAVLEPIESDLRGHTLPPQQIAGQRPEVFPLATAQPPVAVEGKKAVPTPGKAPEVLLNPAPENANVKGVPAPVPQESPAQSEAFSVRETGAKPEPLSQPVAFTERAPAKQGEQPSRLLEAPPERELIPSPNEVSVPSVRKPQPAAPAFNVPRPVETEIPEPKAHSSVSSVSHAVAVPVRSPQSTVDVPVGTPTTPRSVPSAAVHSSPVVEQISRWKEAVPARPEQLHLQVSVRDQLVDLRVTSRQEKIQVAVQATDPKLAESLRSDLSTLTSRLQEKGFRTELRMPTPINPISPPATSSERRDLSQTPTAARHAFDSGGQPSRERNGRRPAIWDEEEQF